jgi:hypothetical protein
MVQTTSQPTRYQTTLAQLGWYLAGEDALDIEIVDEGIFVNVSWCKPGIGAVQRCFREGEIAHLRPAEAPRPGSRSRAGLLAALGTELDRARMDVGHIAEETDGFLVTGSLRGMYTTLRFSYAQLQGHTRSAPPPPVQELPARWSTKRVASPTPVASEVRFAEGDTEVIPREQLRHLVG